jgi:hypothetical protein
MAQPVFIKRERFERTPRQVSSRRLEALRELIGYLKRHIHEGHCILQGENDKG